MNKTIVVLLKFFGRLMQVCMGEKQGNTGDAVAALAHPPLLERTGELLYKLVSPNPPV